MICKYPISPTANKEKKILTIIEVKTQRFKMGNFCSPIEQLDWYVKLAQGYNHDLDLHSYLLTVINVQLLSL